MIDGSAETESTERHAGGHPRLRRLFVVLLLLTIAACLGVAALAYRTRERYRAEIARLHSAMSDLERARLDHLMSSDESKLRLALTLIRKQARLEPALHLSVSVDSNAMYLEHEGATLRAMPIEIAAERSIGIAPDTVHLAPPRGVRTVARILSESEAWEVPAWVYTDRGLTLPGERAIGGALGPAAILLDGGSLIYTMPAVGPLNDSAYVLPGAIRVRRDDMMAILPNLHAGMRVYFY
jgi:hypothetical protein